jgi:hypothetical protein
VKLTDFGLATGALNSKRIESLKIKVRSSLSFDTLFRHLLTSTGYSWTKLKITKLYIAPQWNGALCIVLFEMRIFVTQIQSLDRRTTWRPRYCAKSPILTRLITGLWGASCLSSLQASPLSVVVHQKRHGPISRIGPKFYDVLSTTNPKT